MRKIVVILIAALIVVGVSMLCGCVENLDEPLINEPQFEKYTARETVYPGTTVPMANKWGSLIRYMGIENNTLVFVEIDSNFWGERSYFDCKFNYNPGMTCVVAEYKLGNITVEDFDNQVISYDYVTRRRVE